MAKKIAVSSGKGGVGKTITSLSVAVEIHMTNPDDKILVCDLDPSTNTTVRIIENPEDLVHGANLATLLGKDTVNIEEAIYPCHDEYPGTSVLASCESLDEIDIILLKRKNRENILKRILAKVEDEFDWIIMDCPPNRGILVVNALVAADAYITPFAMDTASLDGVLAMHRLVEELVDEGVIDEANQPVNLGAFPIGFDYGNSRGTKSVMLNALENIKSSLLFLKNGEISRKGSKPFFISKTTHVREAIAANTTLQFQRDHKVSLEYQTLSRYIIKQLV